MVVSNKSGLGHSQRYSRGTNGNERRDLSLRSLLQLTEAITGVYWSDENVNSRMELGKEHCGNVDGEGKEGSIDAHAPSFLRSLPPSPSSSYPCRTRRLASPHHLGTVQVWFRSRCTLGLPFCRQQYHA